MEYKIDLSKLTPVELEDRVKGNWYVVANFIDDNSTVAIRRWHSDYTAMLQNGNQDSSVWNKWFEIPPNLPGFPKAELPYVIKFDREKYDYHIDLRIVTITKKPENVETLVLPPSSIVGKDKYGRDIWRSPRGSFYIIITPRSGGCAYKKYIKTING